MKLSYRIACVLFLLSAVLPCEAADNPLLPGKGGYMGRYNGEYYLLSSVSNRVLRSSDLTEWNDSGTHFELTGAKRSLSGNGELNYRNGVFHLYSDRLGHLFSPTPAGPYLQGKSNSRNVSAVELFQDGSGDLAHISRTIGSKKAGEIWIGEARTPWPNGSRPTQLLDGRRGMWDSLDSANLDHPYLYAYRDNYYLLYTANSPSPRSGLREIGVATGDRLLKMDNEGKAPEAVLLRNAERFAREYTTILPTAEYGEWYARYTLKEPSAGWQNYSYRLSGWRTGFGAFGDPSDDLGTQLHSCRTKWDSERIWIRRGFSLEKEKPQLLALKIRHETGAQVYINGTLVYESSEALPAYRMVDISEACSKVIRPGRNMICVSAASSKDNRAYRYIDFGLYDLGENGIEPAVYNPSHPNLVEGPNGFEKWISYKAYWDGTLAAAMDRAFFFGKELYIDGPTSTNTPGYHPNPALPTFRDLFDGTNQLQWAIDSGEWEIRNGSWFQSFSKDEAVALIKSPPAANYLFEANIQLPIDATGDAGVVAFSDGTNRLTITLNSERSSWTYRLDPGNSLSEKSFSLPKGFKFAEPSPVVTFDTAPFHRLRVIKNGGNFSVMLNHFNLTGENPIKTKLYGAGTPGLYCKNSSAAFDGVMQTVGWDESGEEITAWRFKEEGIPTGGEWRISDDGLEQKRHSQTAIALKGDLLDTYEFTVNARIPKLSEEDGNTYGVLPVFIDKDNYLKAVIDGHKRELVVEGKSKGKKVGPWSASLSRRVPRRHLYDDGTSYKDIVAWVYRLRSESIVSGLEIRWLEGKFYHLDQEFYLPSETIPVRYASIKDRRKVVLWEDGRFVDADEPKPKEQKSTILNKISLRPIKADHISFGIYDIDTIQIVVDSTTGSFKRYYEPGSELGINEELEYADDIDISQEGRPQEVLVNVELESSYFFRCVKLSDKVIVQLNGEDALEIEGKWPASQVGLITVDQPCTFDGITLMHYPEPPKK